MRHAKLFLLFTATTVLIAQPSAPYRVTHTYNLGGDGGWDYIVPDPVNKRLYIARHDRLMVIAEDSGHGFATSGDDQSVLMFDLKNFKVLSRIPAAEDADAILFDKPSNRVFTLNGDANSSTVIDARDGNTVYLPAMEKCMRTLPIQVRSLRSMQRLLPLCASGLRRHASNRCRWLSMHFIIVCLVDVVAE
jgi:hypothetical protein